VVIHTASDVHQMGVPAMITPNFKLEPEQTLLKSWRSHLKRPKKDILLFGKSAKAKQKQTLRRIQACELSRHLIFSRHIILP
jgi:hypothetical protein